MNLTCFKTYDIRGRLGEELNPQIAYLIGRGFARTLAAQRVVLGRDIRASSESLAAMVRTALLDEGVEVLDLGLCGTEEMYFATSHFGADGGIEVTASHNPMDYNGMKMVRAGSAPLDEANGLAKMRRLAEAGDFPAIAPGGTVRDVATEARAAYVARLMGFVDAAAMGPLKVLVNAGNGAAGPTFDAIAAALDTAGARLEFVRLHHEPDGSFPNGIPNPLLAENQPVTSHAVREHGAHLGIAWDGDFDRCFFFDEEGRFIPGEYIVGLLAQSFLQREPGARIVHDPRVIWNTRDIVARELGEAVQARTGHAYLKAALRECDAVYGGEMSAHHYFRDFMYCDSGMIPWLLIIEMMGRTRQSLSQMIAARLAAFPSSGEINFRIGDVAAACARVEQAFAADALSVDETDGLSLAFPAWRFNLRSSNTEPVLRLNVETRGDTELLARKVARLSELILA